MAGGSLVLTALRHYGPESRRPAPSLAAARRYCQELTRSQYENFTVGSWLLPARLRPHFCAVYAYCRWADDLADETASAAQAGALLDWWAEELDACYRGRARHPVFVALAATIAECALPRALLADLLVAFRRDQEPRTYATVEELLEYCRYSAEPVGRIVLRLGGCASPERDALSDSICRGLQWINFCQDVARDHRRQRVYLPRSTWEAAGYTPEMLAREEFNPPFSRALAVEVERAEGWLRAGWPLVESVSRELRVEVALFVSGGLAVAAAIRRQGFDVWSRRPVVTAGEKLRLAAGALWRGWRGGGAGR